MRMSYSEVVELANEKANSKKLVEKLVMEALEVQQSYNATQLRLIIQGTVENITDVTLLQALCNIVVSMEGGVTI